MCNTVIYGDIPKKEKVKKIPQKLIYTLHSKNPKIMNPSTLLKFLFKTLVTATVESVFQAIIRVVLKQLKNICWKLFLSDLELEENLMDDIVYVLLLNVVPCGDGCSVAGIDEEKDNIGQSVSPMPPKIKEEKSKKDWGNRKNHTVRRRK